MTNLDEDVEEEPFALLVGVEEGGGAAMKNVV